MLANAHHSKRLRTSEAVCDGRIVTQKFSCHGSAEVPGIMWRPSQLAESKPLVLLQHGGSGHKEDENTSSLARQLVAALNCVAVAVDGPVHGERKNAVPDGCSVLDAFRQSWVEQRFLRSYVEEWNQVIQAVVELEFVDPDRIGWCGVSMGTAFGLPLIAALPEIKGAVLGKWSANKLNSRHLVESAAHVKCPALFIHHWDDERFDLDGSIELFAALGSEDKRMCIYRGPHNSRTQEEVDAYIAHLARCLKPATR